ncbi:MAG: hypothetical protein RLZZ253_3090, partial [Verrucomicrobiota bacterium]
FGKSVSMIAGLRAENTQIDYRGFQYNVDNDAVTTTTGNQSYTDLLPSVNVRWEQTPNTIVRAAWTNTLARPNYFDLVPYREISLEDNELSTGNPALKPTRAMNFDLMAERYFENVGLLSAGLFHKRITDFIFNFTQFQAVDPVSGQTFSQISRPQNGPEASLTGFEVAAQRQSGGTGLKYQPFEPPSDADQLLRGFLDPQVPLLSASERAFCANRSMRDIEGAVNLHPANELRDTNEF